MARESVDDLSNSDIMSDMVVRESQASDPNEISVLVVDDEAPNIDSLRRIFEREGFSVRTATSGQKALDICRHHEVHVVVSDLMMPGMNGIELVKALKTVVPDAEVVLMTAFGTVEKAVEAMRAGAYDFVEKPLKRMQMVKTVRKAAERHQLIVENKDLRQQLSQLSDRSIIGSAASLRSALEIATQAAPSSANVLILGESGTGKELLARFIHERSGRGKFVGVNLSALPETIVESELFGHEKGSFTGAIARRDGRIAEAEGGTLFLDEIGELSPAVQVKLLRVLQEGEYQPVGGSNEEGRLPAHRSDEPRPSSRGRHRGVSRGSLLPLERHRPHEPAASDTTRGHSVAHRALRGDVLREERQGAALGRARGDRAASCLRLAGQRPRAPERD